MVVRRFAQEYDGPDRDWGAAALALVVECHVDAVRPSQDDVGAQWRASVVYVGPDAQQRGTREQLGPATEAAAGEVLAQDAVAVLMKGEGQRGLAVSRWRGEDDRSLADFNRGSVRRGFPTSVARAPRRHHCPGSRCVRVRGRYDTLRRPSRRTRTCDLPCTTSPAPGGRSLPASSRRVVRCPVAFVAPGPSRPRASPPPRPTGGTAGIAGSERGSRTPTAPLGSRGAPQRGRSP